MKNAIFVLQLIILLTLQIFSQDYNGEQLILSSNGNSEITFKILDFDNNDALVGAKIFSKELNQVISQTDIDGVARISKNNLFKFRIECAGYDSFCFNLTDTTTDYIVVRLLSMEFDYGTKVVHKKDDSLGYSKNTDAIRDIEMGIFQLLRYTHPTLDQFSVAKEFGFTFKLYEGYDSGYIFSNNEEVLNYLSKKYMVDLRLKLLEVCWYNKFFNK